MQQDEVDIAGIVQLAGAELAHAEDGEAARPRRGRRDAAAAARPLSCAARSRCATAARSAASARSDSAPVTRARSHMPPISATAVASATTRLAARSVAASCARGAVAGQAAIAAIACCTGRLAVRIAPAGAARRPRAAPDRPDRDCCRPGSAAWRRPAVARPARFGAAEGGETFDQPRGGRGVGGLAASWSAAGSRAREVRRGHAPAGWP